MRLLPWAPMFAAPMLAVAAYAFALGALLASPRKERRAVRRGALRDVEMDAALAMDAAEAPTTPRAASAAGDDAARATADARVAAAVRRAAAAEARAAEAEAAAAALQQAYQQARDLWPPPSRHDDDDLDAVATPAAVRDARPDARSETESDDGWERMSRAAVPSAECISCGEHEDASRARFAAVPCGHHPLCAACAARLAPCAVCGESLALALHLRD